MSWYSPERTHVPLARVARPFKLALLEQSLALSEIVRRAASAALESKPCAETDEHQPGQPGHDLANASPQPAATQPADDVPVCDEPGEQHDLEGGDHQKEPDRRVARNRELRHNGDEECPGLGVEQIAEQALAQGAPVIELRNSRSTNLGRLLR